MIKLDLLTPQDLFWHNKLPQMVVVLEAEAVEAADGAVEFGDGVPGPRCVAASNDGYLLHHQKSLQSPHPPNQHLRLQNSITVR